jgi:hypothetical protein
VLLRGARAGEATNCNFSFYIKMALVPLVCIKMALPLELSGTAPLIHVEVVVEAKNEVRLS